MCISKRANNIQRFVLVPAVVLASLASCAVSLGILGVVAVACLQLIGAR